ncbi:MAG TPA: hypothetical protein VHZ95_23165 [Polyangiales bacterium]|nr:hypothetical protein [Polyangiales bacterium]
MDLLEFAEVRSRVRLGSLLVCFGCRCCAAGVGERVRVTIVQRRTIVRFERRQLENATEELRGALECKGVLRAICREQREPARSFGVAGLLEVPGKHVGLRRGGTCEQGIADPAVTLARIDNGERSYQRFANPVVRRSEERGFSLTA